ncbi:signal peptidase I [Aeromicrobium wangtongii]|uniref:Signal peptidase I n=1 Tax=Aeromicrobium wangtongii TaxID=2969247 RepID=A0ABY5M3U2_9ACTN|nr:signal peptidase I [Aeromicrobium wangtongii]MCD9198490.1 signal peptidase I [Aeromicrobium wangtongii]UUP12517.1 signal peptidase I [Aeromicrobium wangtongii]
MTDKKRQLPVWQESILLVLTAMVMAVIVKTFFLQAFYIPSESMEPTMLVDDKILVQKVSYWGGDVQRGDIVVFDDPGGWLGAEDSRHATNGLQKVLEKVGLFPTGGHLIKRVIGVGGDTVACCTDGKLTVNGVKLDEPYLLDESATKDRTFEVKVRDGYLWVMGDNRGNSSDSRAHLGDPGGGQVSEKAVVGKAWFRVWPLNRAGFIHKPAAFKAINDK